MNDAVPLVLNVPVADLHPTLNACFKRVDPAKGIDTVLAQRDPRANLAHLFRTLVHGYCPTRLCQERTETEPCHAGAGDLRMTCHGRLRVLSL